MKFVDPNGNITVVSADGVNYTPDENGLFDIQHNDHIAAAQTLGLVQFDPNAGMIVAQTVERVPSEFDATIEALREDAAKQAEQHRDDLKLSREENDRLADANRALSEEKAAAEIKVQSLEEELAALRAQIAGKTGEGTGESTDAPGDTSETKEGGIVEPVWDEMDRDACVDYINNNGGHIAKNVSSDVALNAAKAHYATLVANEA